MNTRTMSVLHVHVTSKASLPMCGVSCSLTSRLRCVPTAEPGGEASIADLALLRVWCAPGARWRATLVLVLRCAASLSARLQAALGDAANDAAAAGAPGTFMDDLRAHLHSGATAQVRRQGLLC